MNWDQIKAAWDQFSDRLQEAWSKLTNEEPAVTAGKRGQLVVVPEGHYTYETDRAESDRQVHLRT